MTERRRQRNPDGTIVEAQIDRVNGKEKGRFHKRQPDGKDDTHEYEAEYPYGGSAVKQSPLQIEGPDGAESGGRRWWQRGT
ncbi:unnamed protein product [Protopolystoma xenopodis]|uniref:Uncharacterized protein n=1 Tax=Protopolystoma xenopodis TaxID=117903 RepID=A0A3S5B8E4_9PLAT|nr:unnamed protein product [Protopolystoma xenopodis]